MWEIVWLMYGKYVRVCECFHRSIEEARSSVSAVVVVSYVLPFPSPPSASAALPIIPSPPFSSPSLVITTLLYLPSFFLPFPPHFSFSLFSQLSFTLPLLSLLPFFHPSPHSPEPGIIGYNSYRALIQPSSTWTLARVRLARTGRPFHASVRPAERPLNAESGRPLIGPTGVIQKWVSEWVIVWVCMYVCGCVCVHECLYMYVCMCVCVCVFVCMYVCVDVYVTMWMGERVSELVILHVCVSQ